MDAKAPLGATAEEKKDASAIDVVVSGEKAKSVDGDLKGSPPPDGGADGDAKPQGPPKDDPPPSSVVDLFRYATPLDVALTIGAIVSAMGHGVVMPLFSLLFG